MPSSKSPGKLRARVQKEVDRLGLYVVAKRIGIVPVTLRAFLLGAPSRPGTIAQIQASLLNTKAS
jgi:hypothetical protein